MSSGLYTELNVKGIKHESLCNILQKVNSINNEKVETLKYSYVNTRSVARISLNMFNKFCKEIIESIKENKCENCKINAKLYCDECIIIKRNNETTRCQGCKNNYQKYYVDVCSKSVNHKLNDIYSMISEFCEECIGLYTNFIQNKYENDVNSVVSKYYSNFDEIYKSPINNCYYWGIYDIFRMFNCKFDDDFDKGLIKNSKYKIIEDIIKTTIDYKETALVELLCGTSYFKLNICNMLKYINIFNKYVRTNKSKIILKYKTAVIYFKTNKYKDALILFREISVSNIDNKYTAKSINYIGRIYDQKEYYGYNKNKAFQKYIESSRYLLNKSLSSKVNTCYLEYNWISQLLLDQQNISLVYNIGKYISLAVNNIKYKLKLLILSNVYLINNKYVKQIQDLLDQYLKLDIDLNQYYIDQFYNQLYIIEGKKEEIEDLYIDTKLNSQYNIENKEEWSNTKLKKYIKYISYMWVFKYCCNDIDHKLNKKLLKLKKLLKYEYIDNLDKIINTIYFGMIPAAIELYISQKY